MMRPYGYTLVEILVVLVIVATLSAVIVIRVGQFGAATPAQQLDRLATVLSSWCQQAVFQQRNLAVRISADGYDFWEPDLAAVNAGDNATGTAGDQGITWRESQHESFGPRTWDGDVLPDLQVAGQITELDLQIPQLRCFASSQMTPFTLRLSQAEQQRQAASLQADSSGRLRLLD